MTTSNDLRAVVDRWGPWTAHNIEVAPGVFTRDETLPNPRLRQILQLVVDIVGSDDLSTLRVADLGCLEGAFAIEMALHGAEVLGLEGRDTNVSRARFAAEALSLNRCVFVQDDVRNFTVERYGTFDVVLCLGLLYHLDARSMFEVLESIHGCTTRALVLDTHVSLRGGVTYRRDGKTYEGHLYEEHRSEDTTDQRAAREWASLDNPESFWPTRAALYDALAAVGYSSVLECHMPQSTLPRPDRVQFVAFRGTPADIRTVAQPPAPLPPYVAALDTGERVALAEWLRATRVLASATRRYARTAVKRLHAGP